MFQFIWNWFCTFHWWMKPWVSRVNTHRSRCSHSFLLARGCPGHHCQGLWDTPLPCQQPLISLQDCEPHWAAAPALFMPATPPVLGLVCVCPMAGWPLAWLRLRRQCPRSNLGNKAKGKGQTIYVIHFSPLVTHVTFVCYIMHRKWCESGQEVLLPSLFCVPAPTSPKKWSSII